MENAEKILHQGFTLLRLESAEVSLTIAPDLGAKIVSLIDRKTGRDWMWRPPSALNLWENPPGDSFTESTFVGADECLPTVNPCLWKGRNLPDHGEVWNLAWDWDESLWEQQIIYTSVHLPISPFRFTRTASLCGRMITLTYELLNDGSEPEFFLWAFHPLVSLENGDRLELPATVKDFSITSALNLNARGGQKWTWPSPAEGIHLDELQLGTEDSYVKAFTESLTEGWASLVNLAMRDRLTFRWDTTENSYLGLWLTRGGFNGWHHPALEPTNAPADSLTEAHQGGFLSPVAPGQSRSWKIHLEVGESPR